MKSIALPSGERIPALGLGTWCVGDDPAARAEEIATLQLGLDLGVRLIDTAEMYGNGRSEELVGEALRGRRDEAFVVSKVLPQNATRAGTMAACERSLRRLGTDRIDLYLLHWRGAVPFAETLAAFEELTQQGKILHFGVSNLDLADMQELWKLPGGPQVATNQLLYNLQRRVPVMAYSPIEQGRLLRDASLVEFARDNGITAAQAALAWLLHQDDVIVIPKTGNRQRLRENLLASEVQLSPAQLAELNELFPAPTGPTPLEML